jgi:ABC-type glycerol-3-phosphate transport system substrate-binding protein
MLRRLLAASLIALAAGAGLAAAPAEAADRRVQLVNASSTTVVSFHASNAKRSSWEEDILGNDVLEPGQRVTVNIDDGTGACVFDFLSVLQGGQRIERRGINVCEITTYTIR